MEAGEKIALGFVVARGDGAELFEFTEKVLDEVARLAELPGQIHAAPRGLAAAGLQLFAGGREGLEDSLVGVEGPVGDQQIGGHLRQERLAGDQIVRRSRGQQES